MVKPLIHRGHTFRFCAQFAYSLSDPKLLLTLGHAVVVVWICNYIYADFVFLK
jgi:hypothetical protein